jgi:predicted Rossmann fold flavoprotein
LAAATRDVVVIGAGASGLFCAATAGARGRTVLVIDHAKLAGAKIRVSGGGRCNFTNRGVGAGHYLSANPHFAKSALARFTPEDLVALVEGRGIRYHEREDGQLFCDGSAREIVVMLESRCAAAGVASWLGCPVAAVAARPGGGFTVETPRGAVRTASLVVATGGLSYAKLGASGFGLDLARRFGLGVVPPRPALVPFVFAGGERDAFGALAGVSLDAAIASGGTRRAGKLLFTHRGLSGPVALQASLRWRPGEALSIDLLPGTDVLARLVARRRGGTDPAAALAALLPKRLARAWCARAGLTRPLDQTPERELQAIAAGLHDWRLVPGGTEGYATAEVTAGGVDTAGLSSTTMEARGVPGLHFVGEVVDVTGELGGYNLHWAFASGRAAGMSV